MTLTKLNWMDGSNTLLAPTCTINGDHQGYLRRPAFLQLVGQSPPIVDGMVPEKSTMTGEMYARYQQQDLDPTEGKR
ncbi:hypothetical protein PHYPSEUDO_011102 [Phytophthora pseudosyringae]|uniref:Uncharacterized protein n=1 Tax=Phytophthora pseudosyringae TaxID=221518 RepID=A0A8T1WA73_9STRA|nr:hypothetical protein PHYPSEUDO_011102 [Phytophthora pseudosyringae]